MSARPEQPEPFVRGCVNPASGSVAYPRLPVADADQLPGDVWQASMLPALVRLELVGDASAVRVCYRTATGSLGYRGDSAGCTFTVFRSGRKIAEEPAILGDGEVVLALPGNPAEPAIVYLPEGMRPVVRQLQPLDGGLLPAPRQPRCLVVGDAVTQGWLASAPAASWPAIIGRKLGLDIANLAFAGTTRLEVAVAQAAAATPAEAVVVNVGTGCWSRPPHSAALLAESLRSFVELVRAGHPGVPLVVVSPLLRPAAEDVPNVFGATLGDLRRAVEDTVMRLAATDPALALVPGEPVLSDDDLADGVYPGDEGHRRIAAAVSKVLAPRVQQLRQAALSRWQEEVMAATPAFAGQLAAAVPGARRPVPPTGDGHGRRPEDGGGGAADPDDEPSARPEGRSASDEPGASDGSGVPEEIVAAAKSSAAAVRAWADAGIHAVAAAG